MPDRELTDALLEVIRRRMEEQSISGRVLAERLGMHFTTVAKHLRGEGVVPIEEWEAIAVALGDSRLEDLLEAARRRL